MILQLQKLRVSTDFDSVFSLSEELLVVAPLISIIDRAEQARRNFIAGNQCSYGSPTLRTTYHTLQYNTVGVAQVRVNPCLD